jgi:hypothetical protein
MAAALDARGEDWQLWRNADGWVIQLGNGRNDPACRTVSDESLHETFKLALESKRLPIIPRCPVLRHWTITKHDGSRPWQVLSDNWPMFNYRLKRDAVGAKERAIARQRKAYEEWHRDHERFVATHEEGKDFVYVD